MQQQIWNTILQKQTTQDITTKNIAATQTSVISDIKELKRDVNSRPSVPPVPAVSVPKVAVRPAPSPASSQPAPPAPGLQAAPPPSQAAPPAPQEPAPKTRSYAKTVAPP